MDNTIVFLNGHAGVGKLTTAKAIAKLTGARIVDNHTVNNPIFGLIQLYGNEPLPEAVWGRVGEVRQAIFETIATLSPPEWSFIFTMCAYDDMPRHVATYRSLREVAQRRRARFLPVRLTCQLEMLTGRIVSPERKLLLKDVSAESAHTAAQRPLLSFEEQYALDIDNTALPAEAVAERIVAAAAGLR